MDVNPTSRSCGPCTACCKMFTIPEVGKFDASWCRYRIAGKGCGTYPDRPYACQMFACMWLNEKGGESDRPDLLGVMMDIADFEVGGRECGILRLWEIEEGTSDKPRVQIIAESAKDQGFIVAFHRFVSASGAYECVIEIPKEWFSADEYKQIAEMAAKGLL